MTDIADFVTALLDEEEAAARATTPVPVAGRWRVVRDKHAESNAPLRLVQGRDPYGDYGADDGDYSYGVPVIAFSAEWQDEAEADLHHIARWDPARVLAEVALWRSIIEDYRIVMANNAIEKANGASETEIAARDLIVKSLRMVLRRRASLYADHPEYRQEWVP